MINWELIFCNLLFIIGLNKATYYRSCTDDEKQFPYCNDLGIDKESMQVLWFIRYYSINLFGAFYTKPICTCIQCMASVWGTLGYLAYYGLEDLSMLPVYVIVLSGLGHIASRFLHE